MEKPSGLPQADPAHQSGERLLQPQTSSHPNIVPVTEPPTISGSSQAPRAPSRTPPVTGKKQMSSNKVAIPRQRSGAAPRYSRRVPLACETCRMRKTKCSGDTPVCRQCLELRVECRYPVSWRERTKGFVIDLSPHSALWSLIFGLDIVKYPSSLPRPMNTKIYYVILATLLMVGLRSGFEMFWIKYVLI